MHSTEIRVPWFDVDREDVVFFGNYFRFFQVAEDDFLRSMGLGHRDLKKNYGIGLTRIEVRCRYKRSAKYEDLIEVETRVQVESDTLVTFDFRIFRKEGRTLLAEGNILAGCVKLGGEFSLAKMPEEVEARLRQAMTDDRTDC